MGLKKRSNGLTGGLPASVQVGSLLDGDYPILEAHLSDLAYDDGSPRVTSTLLLFVEAGSWKACLCARDSDEVAFVTAGSVGDLLSRLEASLEAGELDWRRRAGPRGGKR